MTIEAEKTYKGLKPISIITDVEEERKPTEAFDTLSKAIAGIIIKSNPNFTIGILGEWGSGKTTLMKSVQQKFLENGKENEWISTAWFNAWRYERETEHATVPLILTILERLFKQIKQQQSDTDWFSRTKDRLAKYVKGWSFSLSIPIAFAELKISQEEKGDNSLTNIPKPTIQEGLELIKEFTGKIKTELPSGLKLVVFIDDLDRCSPKKAIEVLESIKILLNIQGLVYVLGLSHDTVGNLISAEYEKSKIKGKDYIKKIIQIPIRVPVWEKKDFIAILNNNIKPVLDKEHFKILDGKEELLRTAVKGNPRELKRLVNSIVLALEFFGEKEGIKGEELLVVELMRSIWFQFFDNFSSNEQWREKIKEFVGEGEDKLNQKLMELRRKEEKALSRVEKRILEIDYELWEFIINTSTTLFGIENWENYRSVTKAIKEEIIGEEEISRSPDRLNLLNLLRKGRVDVFNEIRKSVPVSKIDLRGADLRGVRLEDVDFSRLNMINSDFSNSILERVNFNETALYGVYFRKTKMNDVDFANSLMKGTNFANSKLNHVNFEGADLVNSIFVSVEAYDIRTNKKTRITGVNFSGSNLKHEDFPHTAH